jgi:hypothetical protein
MLTLLAGGRMYCHYCGRTAVGSCPACGHRVCADHRRPWLFLSVCKKCYASMWVGTASAAALAAGAAALYLYAVRG